MNHQKMTSRHDNIDPLSVIENKSNDLIVTSQITQQKPKTGNKKKLINKTNKDKHKTWERVNK